LAEGIVSARKRAGKPKTDKAIATVLVQRYLDAMGGKNNGHIMDWPERALIERFCDELRRARRDGVKRARLSEPHERGRR
jgi:hypothetical protein